MMIVDLHAHTRHTAPMGASPGGALTHEEAIARARAAGLDAICFTERPRPAGVEEALAAGKREGFPVFVGVEIPLARGRILFVPKDVNDPEFVAADWAKQPTPPAPEELAQRLAPRGLVIVVTPYHREAARLPMGDRVFLLQNIHAVEAFTGRSGEDGTAEELAVEAAGARGIPVVGGSDLADDPAALGVAATLLRFPAASQEELCRVILSGDAWSAQIGRAPAPVRAYEDRPRRDDDRPRRRDDDDRPRRRDDDRPPRRDGDRRRGPPRR